MPGRGIEKTKKVQVKDALTGAGNLSGVCQPDKEKVVESKGINKSDLKDLHHDAMFLIDRGIARVVDAFVNGADDFLKESDESMEGYIKEVLPALTYIIPSPEDKSYWEFKDKEIKRMIKAAKRNLGIKKGTNTSNTINRVIDNNKLYRVGYASLYKAAEKHDPLVMIVRKLQLMGIPGKGDRGYFKENDGYWYCFDVEFGIASTVHFSYLSASYITINESAYSNTSIDPKDMNWDGTRVFAIDPSAYNK